MVFDLDAGPSVMRFRRRRLARTAEGRYPSPRGYADGFDDGGLADAGPPVITSTLDISAEPDRGDLAFGEGRTDTLLDPTAGRPGRSRATAMRPCQSHQSLGDGALCAIQTGQKHTGRFASTRSAARVPSCGSIRSSARCGCPAASSSFSASGISSSVGKPQCPSSIGLAVARRKSRHVRG